jgi:hypothetical protein
MNEDQRLLDDLRNLPRLEAGETFTRQVLLRLDDREDSSRLILAWPRLSRPRLGWAMAAALLLVVTIGGATNWEKQRRREEIRGELARLRSAQAELLEEFRQAPPPAAEGLVYIGSDDGTDYLLDLGEARSVDLSRQTGSTTPASNIY